MSELTIFEKVYWARRSGGVRRFHTHPFLGVETVFHHSASVAQLLLQCVKSPSAALLTAALSHDLEEGFVGDLPAPMRWKGSKVKEVVGMVEREVRQFYNWGNYVLTDEEQRLLHAADFLDCAFTVREQQRMGNQFAVSMLMQLIRRDAETQVIQKSENKPMIALWETLRSGCWPDVSGSDFWLKHE